MFCRVLASAAWLVLIMEQLGFRSLGGNSRPAPMAIYRSIKGQYKVIERQTKPNNSNNNKNTSEVKSISMGWPITY